MRIFKNNTTEEIVATSAEFKTMSIGETYDNYGQQIDTEETGDWDVVAYTYWDGHNWKSIIIQDDLGYVEWDEITGSEAKPYLDAIENKEKVKEEFGVIIYRYGDMYLAFRNFASAWEDYRFMDESEVSA